MLQIWTIAIFFQHTGSDVTRIFSGWALGDGALNTMLCKYTLWHQKSCLGALHPSSREWHPGRDLLQKLFWVLLVLGSALQAVHTVHIKLHIWKSFRLFFFFFTFNVVLFGDHKAFRAPPLVGLPWQRWEWFLKICNFLILCCRWSDEKTNFSSLQQSHYKWCILNVECWCI